MSAKKVSRMLHIRINELLDRILENGTDELDDQPELNLGDSEGQLMVSMESFFQFNFDLSRDMDDWIDGHLEESDLDTHYRQWDSIDVAGDRVEELENHPVTFDSSKRPK